MAQDDLVEAPAMKQELLHICFFSLYSCSCHHASYLPYLSARPSIVLTLTVLVATIDAQWEGMGDVGLARYEPALLPPSPTIRVLSYSNW